MTLAWSMGVKLDPLGKHSPQSAMAADTFPPRVAQPRNARCARTVAYDTDRVP